ncbi:MAG TPA: hotdog domain-containing protein, partial [Streptosporangiaceae bacterium]
MAEPGVLEFPVQVRYMEVDAQGVVFNAWYLTYFDEAFAAYLAARGLPYQKMIDSGFDVQVVHTDLDWTSGLRWGDHAAVAVATARVGRTSFALDFQTRRDGQPTCTARTVYVV